MSHSKVSIIKVMQPPEITSVLLKKLREWGGRGIGSREGEQEEKHRRLDIKYTCDIGLFLLRILNFFNPAITRSTLYLLLQFCLNYLHMKGELTVV